MSDAALPTLHVMFGMSAAGSLRQALELAGRDERVVGLPDDLSFGRIDPPDAAPRVRQWYDLGDYDDEDFDLQVAQLSAFWQEAVSPAHRLVAWMSRQATSEYCGFLEWLWRLGDRQAEMVDVTGGLLVKSRNGSTYTAYATGTIPAISMVSNGLLDAGFPIAQDDRLHYQALWSNLRSENASLRVFVNGKLVSGPLSFYDDRLLSYATHTWRKAARVVGETMASRFDSGLIEVGDLVLWARLRALVEAGQLEAKGDLLTMQTTEVRLPVS